MTLNELRQNRAKIVADARAIAKKAEDEKREMTAEERSNFDKALNDSHALKADIERHEALEAEERSLQGSAGRQVPPGDPNPAEQRNGKPYSFELRGQKYTLNPNDRGYVRTTDAYQAAERTWLRTGSRAEYRTAAAFANDIDADGGYLHAPQQFVASSSRPRQPRLHPPAARP
jgi:HK97 family phage major capsid protein